LLPSAIFATINAVAVAAAAASRCEINDDPKAQPFFA